MNNQYNLTPIDLEPLQKRLEDITVSKQLVYADIERNKAQYSAFELECSRLCAEHKELSEDVAYIKEQYGEK